MDKIAIKVDIIEADINIAVAPIEPPIIVEVAVMGTKGKDGVDGIDGADGEGDKFYTHSQGVPSAVWTINHGLNKKPAVTVIDSASSVIEGAIEYIDDNSVQITFSSSFSGTAIFN